MLDDRVDTQELQHEIPVLGRRLVGQRAERSAFRQTAGIDRLRAECLFHLAQDVPCTHHRVLQVRTGLALEGQRRIEVESDDAIARIAQHVIAHRTDGDAAGHLADLRGVQFGVALLDFAARTIDQGVQKIVRFDAQAFAAGHLQVRASAILVA